MRPRFSKLAIIDFRATFPFLVGRKCSFSAVMCVIITLRPSQNAVHADCKRGRGLALAVNTGI